MTPNAASGSLLGKIASYVEILSKDPRSTVFVSLADSYRQMGLLDEALDVATNGVKALPSFSPGYAILGRIQVQLGNFDAAAVSFERALLIDPESLMSLKGLARVRMLRGDQAEALKLVRRAAALKPDDTVAQKMLTALGAAPAVSDTSAASQSATVAEHLHADPISTPTIAEIYIRQGFLGRAMKVYRDLLQADPHNEDIRQKLVDLKHRMEEPKSAPAAAVPAVLTAMEEVSAPPAEAVAPLEAEIGGAETAKHVAVLTRWLDSISRRRTDVR